ncbi:MAG TPA: LapA family protein, partial [Sedimentibacter sp.]|nr:LapA family protein [Sedimentibacter sp.]
MQIGFIVILIIAIFVAIFAIQNGTPVPVDLFFARYEMPLAVIMMICLILGAVIVLILGTTRQFKKRSEHNELKNKLKTLEGEKAKHEIDMKALESEKAQFQTNIEALETEKQRLQNEI